MSVIALIGARSGSKGVPGKNIRLLGGYPLIAWSIRACAKATLIDRIIVSTDSEEYASIARLYGAEVILRPAELATDTSTDYEFIAHALKIVDCEYVAHIRPTTPFRDPVVIDNAIVRFKEFAHRFTALRSIHEMTESAYKTFETFGGLLKGVGVPLTSNVDLDAYNNGRQSFAKTFSANGYVDVLLPKIIRRGVIHGNIVYPFLTTPITEIDTEEDFDYLEWQLSKHPEYAGRIFG